MPVDLFDANFYRAANTDLASFNDAQALSHFQNFGLNEGRAFSPFVNLYFYRSSSSDLTSFNNRQAFEHLQNYGIAEGRSFSPFVDLSFYRTGNGDLAGFSNEQLFEHLRNFGVNEGRRFSPFVDLNFYRATNSDLASFNNTQALQHLEIYGLGEGRRYEAYVTLPSFPDIQISTPDADIVQNRVVFSTVNEEVRTPKTLILRNTGTAPVTITGLSFGDSLELVNTVRVEDYQRASDFNLVNGPALPITLAASSSINLNIQFAPQRVASLNTSDSPTHTKNGENYASLTITSNDPDQPTRSVNLAGLNSANYEGNNEVAVAEIARTFGWTLNVGTEDNILSRTKTLIGDEVYSPYWLPADTTKPVLLWPLAVYTGRGDTPHDSIRFEAKPGSRGKSGLLYELAGRANDDSRDPAPTPPYRGNAVLGSNALSGGENQKLLPKILVNKDNSVPTIGTVDFTPTSAFALNRSGTWTDDNQNGTSELHNWRMFPVRDAIGNLVPNTWFAASDPGNNPNPATGKNFDYNDNVYLLVNAKPE